MSTNVTMRQMLEAGVHFGHQTRFWNPKMAQYIFGSRNKIHIINLEKTLPLFVEAQEYVRRLTANKGTVLFVGTKRQAREIVREEAARAGVPFVDHRWLGGMLTNYKTVKQSIKRLEDKMALLGNADQTGYNKKELLDLQREVEKLERSLGDAALFMSGHRRFIVEKRLLVAPLGGHGAAVDAPQLARGLQRRQVAPHSRRRNA